MFMISSSVMFRTGDMLTEAEYEAYCEAMASSPAWGGQVELRALSSVLQAPIQVSRLSN
jgi:OTU domain-containing protein 6